jgi:hypothetical protein
MPLGAVVKNAATVYRIGSQAIVEPVRTIAILAQRSKLRSSVAKERYLYGARIYKQNSHSFFE